MSPPLRHLLFALLYLLLSVFFLSAFYERYWKWRHQIDEALSSFSPPGTEDNLTSGGIFWIIPAVIFAALAIRRLWKFRRATRILHTS